MIDLGKRKKLQLFKNSFTYNKLTNKKITAIIPTHVWGNACWFDELIDLVFGEESEFTSVFCKELQISKEFYY